MVILRHTRLPRRSRVLKDGKTSSYIPVKRVFFGKRVFGKRGFDKGIIGKRVSENAISKSAFPENAFLENGSFMKIAPNHQNKLLQMVKITRGMEPGRQQ